MAIPDEPKRKHPSTYFVQDRSSKEEIQRLRILDQILTARMGGVFAEQSNSDRFRRVLDVGCGPGGWVLEAARTYLALSVFGIDISKTMIEDARNQVEQEMTGITAHLVSLFAQHGLQQVQTKTHELAYQAGTPQGQAYAEGVKNMFHTLRPFIQKWGCISQDYDTIYQQALDEMQRSNFHVTWKLLTVWGEKPAY